NIHSGTDITSVEPISELVNLETLIMREVPINDNGIFLKNLTKLQRLNAIDASYETIDSNIIVKFRQKRTLQREGRPERMIYTLEAPELSKESGFYNKEFELEIAENAEENTVYYTLDGSEPTLNSSVYEEPIQIEPNDDNTLTVVRAKVLSENN